MSQTDNYFQNPPYKQFEFDRDVAAVFDDMLERSIPLYDQNLTLTAALISRWIKPSGTVVDIGCSTGALLLKLARISGDFTLIGIDSSEAMIDTARRKAQAFGARIDFRCAEAEAQQFDQLDAVSANYLLQFIRPPKRESFVGMISSWLKKDGVFVCSEKLACNEKKLDKIMIDQYLNFKRENGYSDYEISRKREALENVLISYSDSENQEMFRRAGFSHIECVLRWNNFATYFCVK